MKKVNQFDNILSSWELDLNLIVNPTTYRTILIGDAAHSIHPLAGQGLNLALRDCSSVIKSLENNYDPILIVLPSDHIIREEDKFLDVIKS